MSDVDRIMLGIPQNIAQSPDMAIVEEIRNSTSNDNGQTLESSLLIECPFCGCETPYIQTFQLGDCTVDARVVCPECHVSTSREYQSWRIEYVPTGEDITRILAIGKAICSWNRRAK